jgi:hypothetical protein
MVGVDALLTVVRRDGRRWDTLSVWHSQREGVVASTPADRGRARSCDLGIPRGPRAKPPGRRGKRRGCRAPGLCDDSPTAPARSSCAASSKARGGVGRVVGTVADRPDPRVLADHRPARRCSRRGVGAPLRRTPGASRSDRRSVASSTTHPRAAPPRPNASGVARGRSPTPELPRWAASRVGVGAPIDAPLPSSIRRFGPLDSRSRRPIVEVGLDRGGVDAALRQSMPCSRGVQTTLRRWRRVRSGFRRCSG